MTSKWGRSLSSPLEKQIRMCGSRLCRALPILHDSVRTRQQACSEGTPPNREPLSGRIVLPPAARLPASSDPPPSPSWRGRAPEHGSACATPVRPAPHGRRDQRLHTPAATVTQPICASGVFAGWPFCWCRCARAARGSGALVVGASRPHGSTACQRVGCGPRTRATLSVVDAMRGSSIFVHPAE